MCYGPPEEPECCWNPDMECDETEAMMCHGDGGDEPHFTLIAQCPTDYV